MTTNNDSLTLYGMQILASMLGALERLFEPDPDERLDMRHFQLASQLRQTSRRDSVIPFENPGSAPAERKAYDRALSALETAGLVLHTARNRSGLTAEGLKHARRVCHRLQLDEVLCALDFLLSLRNTRHIWTDGNVSDEFVIISECSLAGFEPIPKAKVGGTRCEASLWVIDAVKPLMIAGLIAYDFCPPSHFECPLYYLTSAGQELAEARAKAKQANPKQWLQFADRPEKEQPAAFGTGWDWMAKHLSTTKPPNANIVTHHFATPCWGPREVLR